MRANPALVSISVASLRVRRRVCWGAWAPPRECVWASMRSSAYSLRLSFPMRLYNRRPSGFKSDSRVFKREGVLSRCIVPALRMASKVLG